MKCDVFKIGWLQGCTSTAKWWFREAPNDKYMWHPRCGMHSKIPGNSRRERRPITLPDPNISFHPKGTDK